MVGQVMVRPLAKRHWMEDNIDMLSEKLRVG